MDQDSALDDSSAAISREMILKVGRGEGKGEKRLIIEVDNETLSQLLRLVTSNVRCAIAQTMVHPGECRLELELGSNFESQGIRIRATTEGFLNIAQSRCSDLWGSKASTLSEASGNSTALSRSLKRALGACKKLLRPILEGQDGSTTKLVLIFRSGELSSYEVSKTDCYLTSTDKFFRS